MPTLYVVATSIMVMDNASVRSFLQVLPPVEFACVYGSSLHPSNRDKVVFSWTHNFPFLLVDPLLCYGPLFYYSPFNCCFNICSLLCDFGFLDYHDRLYYRCGWPQTVAFWGTDMWLWLMMCYVFVLSCLILFDCPTDIFCFSFYCSWNCINQES